MLRLKKLPVEVFARTLRASASKPTGVNTIRLQSTFTTAESESHPTTKKSYKNHHVRAPKLSQSEFQAQSAQELSSVDSLLAKNASSKEIFNEFTRILNENVNKTKNFQEYGMRGIAILKKANKELHANSPGAIPITLEEIAALLEKHGILHFTHVSYIMSQLIQDGEYLEALNQALNYRKLLSAKGKKVESADIIAYITGAYLLYTKDTGKTAKDHLLQLIDSKSLPMEHIIMKSIKNLKLDPKREGIVSKKLRVLHFAEKTPNSIQLMKSAMRAAKLGNFKKVDESLETSRAISRSNGIKLGEDTILAYMRMFNLLSRGDYSLKLWNELIESGIKPSVEGWNLLLESVSLSGSDRIQKVELVLNEMKAAGIERTAETHATLIRIYSKFNRYEIINRMTQDEKLANLHEVVFAHLEWLSKIGEVEQANKKLTGLKKEKVAIPIETFNKMLYNFAVKGNYEAAHSLLKDMGEFKIQPDVVTFSIILDCTLKLYQKAGLKPNNELFTDFLKDMKKNKIEVNEQTTTSIMSFLSKDIAFRPTAELLFDYLRETNGAARGTYFSMISSQLNSGDIAQAELFLHQYQEAGFPVDGNVWSIFFKGFKTKKVPAKAVEYLDKVLATGEFKKNFNKYSADSVLSLAQTTHNKVLSEKIVQLVELQKVSSISPKGIQVMKKLIEEHAIPVSDHVQQMIQKSG